MVNYIDNKKFEELIVQYTSGDYSSEDELFELFDILITRIMDGFNFNLEKDDAKQETFLLILKVLKNFDSSNGAAFNYFTTIILNNCRFLYTKRRKYEENLSSYVAVKLGGYAPSSANIDPL